MTINDYYTDELQALRVLGAEFSEKNPGLSSFLARKGQDPDVERLLEGFAFLSGRVRQYIDEELPEVSHALAQLLWPNYLQPIPSFSILKFEPSVSDAPVKVPKGEEVMAVHPENDEQCIFQTCYETTLLPLDIEEARYYTHGTGSVIELELSTIQNRTLEKLAIEKLRFYIGNYEHLSDNLFYYLMNHIENIEVRVGNESLSKELPAASIKAVGFAEDEKILPPVKNVSSGYTLLQEYFCFRGKYHFIDICGLDILKRFPAKSLQKNSRFTIKITLGEKLKITKSVTKENFQLYCTPIINIFETEAEPIRKGLQEEYEVIPAGTMYKNSEVYSIKRVQGWDSRLGKYHKYIPFESFEHAYKNTEYYYTRVKLSEDHTRTKTFIRFFNGAESLKSGYENGVTLSLDLLITNKDLPSTLDIGEISQTTSRSTMSSLSFKNITIPTKSYTPPIHGDFLWRIISNMSLNYTALENIETLKNIVETYDFIGATDALQKKQTESLLEGLEEISYEAKDMIYRGFPIRGVVSRLRMNSKKFSTIGEAYLFATVLNRFFSLFASVNSFHKLEVTVDKKASFTWTPHIGEQALL